MRVPFFAMKYVLTKRPPRWAVVHNLIRRHCDQNCKQLFMLAQQANWWEEAREIQLFMIVLLLLLQATPHHQQTWKSQSYCGGGCARKRLGWENWTIMRLHFLVKIWKGGNKPKLLTLLKYCWVSERLRYTTVLTRKPCSLPCFWKTIFCFRMLLYDFVINSR